MKRFPIAIHVPCRCCLLVGSRFWPSTASAAEEPKTPPKDRVVAMYFHRTQRCPTCLKMGSYTEEALKTGFAKQLKDTSVEFHYIDFQNEKNAAYAKAYKVTGPALIVAKVARRQSGRIQESQGHLDERE